MPAQNTASKTRPNLLRRKQGWYARYHIPKSLQPVVGRLEVVRTLRTRDKLEAHRRLPTVLSEIAREVAELARTSLPVDYRSAAAVLRELESLEDAVRRDRTIAPAFIELGVENVVDRHFDSFPEDERCPQTGIPHDATPEILETAQRVLKVAGDQDYRTLSEWLREHLASMERDGKVASTRAKRERAINDLISSTGARRDPRTLRTADVVKYGDSLRSKDWSTRVKKDVATNVHTFFEWLRKHRRIIETNPFHGLSEQIEGSRKDGATVKRAWHPEELQTIVTGLNPKGRLWAVAAIALYSGMRINEICSLEVAHVSKRGMAVTPANAKNANSVRTVPIHPVIAPMVERLAATSYDGFLISGLKRAGQDKRRGAYPSKRFSEARKELGLTARETSFHSFRHNFITAAERRGIPLSTLQKIVGHARQGITLDRYSDGPEWKQLVAAVAQVTHDREAFDDFPALPLDAVVASFAETHQGNAVWKKRYLRELVPNPDEHPEATKEAP